jgi:hypothetical protein
MQGQPLLVPAEASTTWLVLVATLASLFLLYVAWRMIRGLLLYPLGSWEVFGSSTSARLVALGITALIVPKAVTAMVMVPVSFLLQLVDRMPRLATRIAIADAARDKTAAYSIKEPVIQLSITFQDMVGELAKAFATAIAGIPMPEMVLGLACWAVLGNLMSTAVPPGDLTGAQSGENRLIGLLKALSTTQRYGIVLTTVFLLGAYLSIAAIVAIPWLHEERVPPALNRESLEKTLTGILPTPAQLEERLRSVPVANESPLAPLSAYLSTLPKSAGVSAPYGMTTLNAAIADTENIRANAIAQVRRMPAEIARKGLQMIQTALGAFDVETASPMSSQERGFFLKEIQRSISSDVGAMESTLSNCVASISDTDKRLREIALGTRSLLIMLEPGAQAQAQSQAQAQAQAAVLEEQQLVDMAQASSQLSSVSVSMRGACEAPLSSRSSGYAPPEPGSTWGPFGLVARWLLRTKSFALTLITGMLGFGLLGSVISTFVRSGTSKEGVSLTSEIISVLVRGLSAAVVVFLAVKGGLAVFSSADAEPNAYVVFFTCLIGAVFSEDVWKWAHEKFLDNLSAKPDSARQPQSMAETISRRSDTTASKQDDSTTT